MIKPQVAFFERCGSAGLAALESVLEAARTAGLLAIADGKRGDIGSTMEAYARAWLDPHSPLRADAVTAAPYLGLGALQPMIDLAGASGRGVLVVARSSNPEGRSLQQALTDGGRGPAVEDMLLSGVAELNRGGRVPPGTVGAVVGATLGPSGFRLAELGGVILAPGVGAQGGTAAGVGALFGACPPGIGARQLVPVPLAPGPRRGRLARSRRPGPRRDGRGTRTDAAAGRRRPVVSGRPWAGPGRTPGTARGGGTRRGSRQGAGSSRRRRCSTRRAPPPCR